MINPLVFFSLDPSLIGDGLTDCLPISTLVTDFILGKDLKGLNSLTRIALAMG
jgi:hypothetical protein